MSALSLVARRSARLYDALGRTGFLIATAAALLLVLAFGAAVATVVALTNQDHRENTLAINMTGLLDEVESAALGLLRVLGTEDGASRRDEVRARWLKASDRIGVICPAPDVAGAAGALCKSLVDLRDELDRELRPARDLPPAALDHVTQNLLAMIAHLVKFEEEYRADSDAARDVIDDQQSLMIALVVGTGGAMASSFVLFYVLVGAAAAQRVDMMKLRAIVESSGALIALVDSDRRIVLANQTFLEATDKRLDEVIGQRYEAVVDGGDAAPALAAWVDGTQRGGFAFDQPLGGDGRTLRIVRMTASHAQAEADDGHFTLFLGVDETARRLAEVRTIDAARLATLGEMATGVAHEINQPLAVVQFVTDAMDADITDGLHTEDPAGYAADTRGRLKRIGEQMQRAAGIVRRLQGFARNGVDEAQPFDVAEAVRGATEMVHEQMRLARVDIAVDLPAGLPMVHGHANRLQQVVVNLMLNARDAIGEPRTGDVVTPLRGRIDVRAFHDATAGRLVVEIGDNGPGIAEHVLPRLFEAFFTTKPKGRGTGLGLSISTEIVREMGGAITAENRPQDRGALFRLSFPIQGQPSVAHDAAVGTPETSVAAAR